MYTVGTLIPITTQETQPISLFLFNSPRDPIRLGVPYNRRSGGSARGAGEEKREKDHLELVSSRCIRGRGCAARFGKPASVSRTEGFGRDQINRAPLARADQTDYTVLSGVIGNTGDGGAGRLASSTSSTCRLIGD